MSKGRYIGSSFRLSVIVICFRFFFFFWLGSASRQTIYALRGETIWCTFCFHFYIHFFFFAACVRLLPGIQTHMAANNERSFSGGLIEYFWATHFITSAVEMAQCATLMCSHVSLAVIQYELHALASSSSPHHCLSFRMDERQAIM